jgi:hypothetical protein
VFRIRIRIHRIHMFLGLLDPDPDPLVRGGSGSGSGSGSFYPHAKIVRKTLIPTILWLSLWIFSLKNDVNVHSKSNKQKKKKLVFAGILKVRDENSRIRIRIRIHKSKAWIRGSGSTPKWHGSGTLPARIKFFRYWTASLLVLYSGYHKVLCWCRYGRRTPRIWVFLQDRNSE